MEVSAFYFQHVDALITNHLFQFNFSSDWQSSCDCLHSELQDVSNTGFDYQHFLLADIGLTLWMPHIHPSFHEAVELDISTPMHLTACYRNAYC